MNGGLSRLYKLAQDCLSFEDFKARAISKSYWYLRPYVSQGIRVDNPWIVSFWNTYKKGG